MMCILDMTFDPTYPHPPDTIDLLTLCIDKEWIEADVLAALDAAGVPNDAPDYDADEFTYHCFSIHANGPGYDPAKKLTERQHNILTCA